MTYWVSWDFPVPASFKVVHPSLISLDQRDDAAYMSSTLLLASFTLAKPLTWSAGMPNMQRLMTISNGSVSNG
jgi:hypothetical protein